MIDKLLCIQNWTAETNGKFFIALKEYTNEEKCEITAKVAKELMKRGNKMNLVCAETILTYATQHFFEVSDNNYKALVYYRLGQLYEHLLENFVKAYTAYEKYTLNNTENEGNHSILLRALILRDNFTYSDELEKEYRMSLGEYDLGLRNDRLYENLGTLIVAEHDGDTDTAEKIKKRLQAIVKADELFFLDLIFKKDTIPDSLKVPEKVISYIKAL